MPVRELNISPAAWATGVRMPICRKKGMIIMPPPIPSKAPKVPAAAPTRINWRIMTPERAITAVLSVPPE
jgi:hypothetical protein